MYSIADLMAQGTDIILREGEAAEAGKSGVLRAGNTGAMVQGGKVLGKCARLTYLRYKGIQVEDETGMARVNRELMFEAGRGNEDLWVSVLQKSWVDAGLGIIRREEQVPIAWTTPSGVPVTGRPDLVLCDKDGTPKIGIELKLVCSLWTARDVAFNLHPKTMHLLQAAHYSWKLDVPFELWYTCRADFAVGGEFQSRMFPQPGTPGSELCEYNPKGVIKKVKPFRQGYKLEWSDKGQLMYSVIPRPGQQAVPTEKVYTLITKQGIQDYYETIASMETQGFMPPRPATIDEVGDKAGYSLCSYCPLLPTCQTAEKKGLGHWMAAVQEYVDKPRTYETVPAAAAKPAAKKTGFIPRRAS